MVKRFALVAASAPLDHWGMTKLDPLAAALARLCAKEGGHVAVADRIGMNDQSVYQVINGIRDSKTKNPKSVGSRMRKALDQNYPDWLTEDETKRGLSDWPFSADLLSAATKAAASELRKAENAARIVLDLDPLPPAANDLAEAA